MVLEILPSQIRQERDLRHLEYLLCKCAAELALLGEVECSSELLSIYYNEGARLGNYSRVYPGLAFVWRQTGRKPEGISEEDITDLIEVSKNAYIGSWKQAEEEKKLYDKGDLEACLSVLTAKGDQHADATTGASSMNKSAKIVKALVISLKLNDAIESTTRFLRSGTHVDKKRKTVNEEAGEAALGDRGIAVTQLDHQSADIVDQIVSRWMANQQIFCLTQAEQLWSLYIRGLLADAIGVSKDELTKKGETIINAFSGRFKKNPEPEFAAKSMEDLLQIGEKNTLHEGPGREYFVEAKYDIPNTFFKSPATDQEIAELETDLETTLPEDYKEFLRITNGFGNNQDGVFDGYSPSAALYAINEVTWNDEAYFQLPVELLDLPRDIEDLAKKEKKVSGEGELSWDTPLPLFDRVLEIGTRDIDNLWLVHPQLVEECKIAYNEMFEKGDERQKKTIVMAMEAFAGSKDEFEKLEWCCVMWSSGGSASLSAYASFRHYLLYLVQESQIDKSERYM
jgi:hypothetical protein